MIKRVRLARESHFDDHVIVRVRQQRPPEEENLLSHRDGANLVDQSVNMASSLTPRQMSKQDSFVLGHERHRDSDLESAAADRIDDLERCTEPRSPCDHEHRCVENDTHSATVSQAIP